MISRWFVKFAETKTFLVFGGMGGKIPPKWLHLAHTQKERASAPLPLRKLPLSAGVGQKYCSWNLHAHSGNRISVLTCRAGAFFAARRKRRQMLAAIQRFEDRRSGFSVDGKLILSQMGHSIRFDAHAFLDINCLSSVIWKESDWKLAMNCQPGCGRGCRADSWINNVINLS